MNWVALKSLNELYRDKQTKIKETLIKDSLFQHLLKKVIKFIILMMKNFLRCMKKSI